MLNLRATENGMGTRLVSFTMYSTAHICTKPWTYIPQLPNKVVTTSWEVGGIDGDEVVWRPALLPLAGSQQEDLWMRAEWQWRTERVLSPHSPPSFVYSKATPTRRVYCLYLHDATPRPLPLEELIDYNSMIISPPPPVPLVWRAGYSKATPTRRVNCWQLHGNVQNEWVTFCPPSSPSMCRK